ncbi:AN1-type zinc finger protein 6 isoform X2 [Astyanax mexicanus]|nr:AN1-type zinc finger protein 6 isoform X2 [Astyanax mexicanus]XP_022525219.2 AN1-type zinc finger protein 6 isoform X2 [Astyanax mexicanus]XP_022525220.2 AN1-type zinc finger protein 6 isoform X2 [Astyanax mexicanus]XP_049321429.1 AN1-type zinc finger protein 6 isoform X2 [Astyanax mexicanus]
MAQQTNQTQVPIPCTAGCGFYGNPRNNGMCSICYKDSLQRQNSSSRVSDPVSTRFSTLGESLSTQSNTVTASSALQLNSQSIVTATERAQEELTSGEAQDELKTEEVAGPSNSAEVASVQERVTMSEMSGSFGSSAEVLGRVRKRKLDEVLQLDGEGASGSCVSVQSSAPVVENSKPKKKRCFICNKKLALTDYNCRCGNYFCGVHRCTIDHNCPYDYKAEAAEKIRKENPVVAGEKIQKI